MKNLKGLSEEKKFKKETDKLEYYLGDTEELIKSSNFKEMAIMCKRTDEILNQLNDLNLKCKNSNWNVMSKHQEKNDNGKKDTKAKYSSFVDKRESLLKMLEKRKKEKAQQIKSENLELKFEKKRQYQQEMHEKQRQKWEEKLDAELKLMQKKLEIENNARATTAKLPKLRITPFK